MKYFKSLALALVAFVFVACGSSQSPSEVAKEFAQKVYDDKIQMNSEEYNNSLSSKSSEKNNIKRITDNLTSIKSYTRDYGGIKEIIINREEMNNDGVDIVTDIFYNNGKTSQIYILLTKENNEWKIVDYGK